MTRSVSWERDAGKNATPFSGPSERPASRATSRPRRSGLVSGFVSRATRARYFSYACCADGSPWRACATAAMPAAPFSSVWSIRS